MISMEFEKSYHQFIFTIKLLTDYPWNLRLWLKYFSLFMQNKNKFAKKAEGHLHTIYMYTMYLYLSSTIMTR